MFRDYIGHSICCLFTTFAFFFSMVFLMGVSKNNKTNNSVIAKVPLQQSDYERWGVIPGTFEFDYSRTVTVYNINKFTPATTEGDMPLLNLNQGGPYQLDATRTFNDPAWLGTKSVIDYTMTYEYSGLNEQTAAEEINMINFGAQSAWYQLTHKPQYLLAQQALAQVTSIIFDSNVMQRYYADNALQFIFNDYSLVQNGVLYGMDPTTQSTIYNDQDYGLSNVHSLSVWVEAHI